MGDWTCFSHRETPIGSTSMTSVTEKFSRLGFRFACEWFESSGDSQTVGRVERRGMEEPTSQSSRGIFPQGPDPPCLCLQTFRRLSRVVPSSCWYSHLILLTIGMFLWFRLLGVSDSTELIKKKAVEEKVLLVPGSSFSPSGSPSPYVRASFSTASKEDMELAMQRLASLLRKNQK